MFHVIGLLITEIWTPLIVGNLLHFIDVFLPKHNNNHYGAVGIAKEFGKYKFTKLYWSWGQFE